MTVFGMCTPEKTFIDYDTVECYSYMPLLNYLSSSGGGQSLFYKPASVCKYTLVISFVVITIFKTYRRFGPDKSARLSK